jgi:predicted nucleic acid-binding protein
MALVLDTSILLAALDPNDPKHSPASSLLGETPEQLIVPVPVLGEFDDMVGRRGQPNVWHAFAEDIATGAYRLHQATPDLVVAASRLQATYQDLGIGFVDAAVFLTCVELREPKVATLDHRHFSVLRTPEGQALEILPG